MLAVVTSYNAVLSVNLNQDAPFEHIFSDVSIAVELTALLQ